MPVVLDHLAIGTPALTDGWELFGGVLGGTWAYGGDSPGFWWGQLSFAAGPKIELMTPTGGPDAAFLERFLASRGAGPHHLNFLVSDIEATLLPQGTFAEAIRAGGAGIAAFFTPVGAGTALAEGKEERVIDGVPYVLEPAIRADVALVFAARADTLGNLWYRRTARNFNPLMATAARVTIAEASEVVPVGGIEPESVMTPHLYIDELVVQA